MSADHAVQTAIRARLVATPAVTALVPAASILDANARPAPDPSIILGESQVLTESRLDRKSLRVVATLHIWKKEPGLAGAKAIAGAIRWAINGGPRLVVAGHHCGDSFVSDMRTLRDPDGETAHGIVTVECLVSEA